MNRTNIYLTGFMAVGKTTVGGALSKKLGLSFLDLDEFIRLSYGYSPSQIIQEHGEEYFRKIERRALRKAASLRHCVIALGGGTVQDEKALKFVKSTGTVVWLKAEPDTVFDRLKSDLNSRPLFYETGYVEMMEKRKEWYALSDISVDTDSREVSKIVEEIENLLNMNREAQSDFCSTKSVSTESAPPYEIVLSDELQASLEKLLHGLYKAGGLCSGKENVIVITSPVLKTLYGFKLDEVLDHFGVKATWFLVEDGESVKKLRLVERMYETAAQIGLSKNSVVFSLGGGSIGDVSGFFASTYCRGLSFIQIPTTLLAMADSSVGGKNGLNLAEGKNLVGTIWQPSGVAIGTDVLMTLNEEELSSGMAEIVKSAIIGDRGLFEIIERNVNVSGNLLNWADLPEIILRAIEVKVALVEKDEKDSKERRLLNLGHTTAHALETLSRYEGMSHGRAVSIGIAVASRLAADSGKLAEEDEMRIRHLLEKLNLPVTLGHVESEEKFANEFETVIALDKKNAGGKMNIVLPLEIGKCIVTSEYDKIDVVKAVKSLIG